MKTLVESTITYDPNGVYQWRIRGQVGGQEIRAEGTWRWTTLWMFKRRCRKLLKRSAVGERTFLVRM